MSECWVVASESGHNGDNIRSLVVDEERMRPVMLGLELVLVCALTLTHLGDRKGIRPVNICATYPRGSVLELDEDNGGGAVSFTWKMAFKVEWIFRVHVHSCVADDQETAIDKTTECK